MDGGIVSCMNRLFYNRFRELVSVTQNEAEVRSAFILTASEVLGVSDLKVERGRRDLARNRVIFEFKDKGLFGGSISSRAFAEAFDQLTTKYIPAKAERDNADREDYIGIAIDGEHFAYVFFEENGMVRHTDLVEISADTLGSLIRLLLEDERKALNGENLMDDFGPHSEHARVLISALWNELTRSLNEEEGISKVKMLFSEWKKLFSQATSMGKIGKDRIDRHLYQMGIIITDEEDYTRALFVLHTYNSILFKLIAAELLASIRYDGDNSGYALQLLSKQDDDLFRSLYTDIESSRLFRDRGIRNFVEGTFFSWYCESNSSAVAEGLRRILSTIVQYIFPTVHTVHVTDTIKHLYENLVPEPLRKNIGEFYTPEWLVEFTLDQVGYTGEEILGKKILDPTCGSGNFLIHAIQRYKQQAFSQDIADEQVLEEIVDNIVGFDLSPLAVLAARLNYLLHISDLLADRQEIEIPVYMADAIYAPTVEDEVEDQIRRYRVGTHYGDVELALPEMLVQDRRKFDLVLEQTEECIEGHMEPPAFFACLQSALNSVESEDHLDDWRPYLLDMYEKILDLELKNWNRIWCRVIRNYFASISIGKVNFIVGNPPWVRWSELPVDYRERVKPTCDRFNIFSETPFFGGNELDISAIVSYSVADKWLENGGKMSFVITKIHFQAPSSEGFRRFVLPDGTPLCVTEVHDWERVRPFPKLANKPVVFVWEKGFPTGSPTPWFLWHRRGNVRIREGSSWAEVEPMLFSERLNAIALPQDGRWSILSPGHTHLVELLSGKSESYAGRKGITTDLNGAYFVRINGPGSRPGTLNVSNLPRMGRKPVPARTFDIEEQLVYPLLKGAADFRAFAPGMLEMGVIVPNDTITSIPSEENFAQDFPLAYRYFSQINVSTDGLLIGRSTWKSRMAPMKAPFYAVYNVGDYTFSEYKVVWAEMASTFSAAVFSDALLEGLPNPKVVIPDHKLYFVPLSSKEEAHYLCALLNSEPVKTFVESYTVKIQVGTIFAHLNLPRYDCENHLHLRLSRLSQLAHGVGVNPYLMGQINSLSWRIIREYDQ